jgi:hypothetical protein
MITLIHTTIHYRPTALYYTVFETNKTSRCNEWYGNFQAKVNENNSMEREVICHVISCIFLNCTLQRVDYFSSYDYWLQSGGMTLHALDVTEEIG